MCLAQGHNAVMLVRLKPATPRSHIPGIEGLVIMFDITYSGKKVW